MVSAILETIATLIEIFRYFIIILWVVLMLAGVFHGNSTD